MVDVETPRTWRSSCSAGQSDHGGGVRRQLARPTAWQRLAAMTDHALDQGVKARVAEWLPLIEAKADIRDGFPIEDMVA